jgi:hypothetical protein
MTKLLSTRKFSYPNYNTGARMTEPKGSIIGGVVLLQFTAEQRIGIRI